MQIDCVVMSLVGTHKGCDLKVHNLYKDEYKWGHKVSVLNLIRINVERLFHKNKIVKKNVYF